MTGAGLYEHLSMAEYLADPAPVPSLSAHIAHALLMLSPAHAWAQHPKLNPAYHEEEATHLDLGKVVHSILLEGDRSKVCVIDANDWRKNDTKEKRDEARAAGMTPILAKDFATVGRMVAEAHRFVRSSEIADVFLGGTPECTLLWEENGIWLRSRPDWLTYNKRLVLDYKSTGAGAEPSAWARGPMASFGCDLQAALGLRGVQAVGGAPRDVQFVFFVQETDPPHACSLVGLAPAYLEFAQAKLERAIEIWRECLETDKWPGYPSRVCWAQPPEYALNQWGERRMNEDAL